MTVAGFVDVVVGTLDAWHVRIACNEVDELIVIHLEFL